VAVTIYILYLVISSIHLTLVVIYLIADYCMLAYLCFSRHLLVRAKGEVLV